MHDATVGILHPGQMGVAIAAAALHNARRVCWASEGRGEATRARAKEAGLTDLGDVAEVARTCEVVLSVCPPAAAVAVAEQVAAAGYAGTYVDANAIAPGTMEQVAAALGDSVELVDGGIVGPPPKASGATRLYLSGTSAPDVASLFERSPFEAIVLDGPAGSASALKTCYATATKATTAMLAATRTLARHHGVEDALVAEWSRSMPAVAEWSTAGPPKAAPKAWRFVGEMEEIATALEDAGLPAGVPQSAAEVYRRLARFKDAPTPGIDEVIDALGHPAEEDR
jgi:3-hydroxyisobutyrate dehydrogenase-like beta-hydroxyacid dehydrogenase